VPAHARLEVVGDRDLGHAAEVGERTHMAPDPGIEILAQHRLDVGEVARAEHRDEQLGDQHLADGRNDLDAVAAEVDEHLLARAVLLTHDDGDALEPPRVVLAELAVPDAVGVLLAILLPEQRLGDVLAPQLRAHERPVGQRPRAHGGHCVAEQRALQRGIAVELGRQGPTELGDLEPTDVVLHGRGRHVARLRDRSARLGQREVQPRNLSDLSHR